MFDGRGAVPARPANGLSTVPRTSRRRARRGRCSTRSRTRGRLKTRTCLLGRSTTPRREGDARERTGSRIAKKRRGRKSWVAVESARSASTGATLWRARRRKTGVASSMVRTMGSRSGRAEPVRVAAVVGSSGPFCLFLDGRESPSGTTAGLCREVRGTHAVGDRSRRSAAPLGPEPFIAASTWPTSLRLRTVGKFFGRLGRTKSSSHPKGVPSTSRYRKTSALSA